jgi:hypothetical protein
MWVEPILLSPGRRRAIEDAVNSQAPRTARTFVREAGLAVAVLAIYVLTLLLPLHQAAGLQRDLDALGFSTLDNWSICQSIADDETGDPQGAAALTCPAAGVAKHDLAAILPPALVIEAPAAASVLSYRQAPGLAMVHLPDHVGQSRAPPVTV